MKTKLHISVARYDRLKRHHLGAQLNEQTQREIHRDLAALRAQGYEPNFKKTAAQPEEQFTKCHFLQTQCWTLALPVRPAKKNRKKTPENLV